MPLFHKRASPKEEATTDRPPPSLKEPSKLMKHNSSSQNTLNGDITTQIYYSSGNPSVNTLTSVNSSDIDKTASSSNQQPSMLSRPQNIDIPEKEQPPKIKGADGEASPDLLATSVGIDGDGRLVPSSSNISLLSLSQQFASATTSTSNVNLNHVGISNTENYNATGSNWSSNLQRNLTSQRLPLLQHQTSLNSSSQVPTLSSFSMQPSNSTISSQQQQQQQQQQLQQGGPPILHHRKFSLNSPSSPSSATFGSQLPPRPPISRSGSTIYNNNTGTQSIQIQSSHNGLEPDSPSLNPTSLAGSPSNFYLSHSSPPGSLKSHNSSYLNLNLSSLSHTQVVRINSRHQQIQQLHQQQPQHQQQQQLHPQQSGQKLISITTTNNNSNNKNDTNNNTSSSKAPLIRADSITDSIGGHSPDFLPVSSALPPMTPLNLYIPKDPTKTTPGGTTIKDPQSTSNGHGRASHGEEEEEAILDDEDYEYENSRVSGDEDDGTQDVFAEQIQDNDL